MVAVSDVLLMCGDTHASAFAEGLYGCLVSRNTRVVTRPGQRLLGNAVSRVFASESPTVCLLGLDTSAYVVKVCCAARGALQ